MLFFPFTLRKLPFLAEPPKAQAWTFTVWPAGAKLFIAFVVLRSFANAGSLECVLLMMARCRVLLIAFFCGRRNTWRSFALCSAVKLWRAVVLRGRSFSAAVHSVLRCGRALFCWYFVAVATFSPVFCNVTFPFDLMSSLCFRIS